MMKSRPHGVASIEYEVARLREVSGHVVKARSRQRFLLRIATLLSFNVFAISLLSVGAQDSLTRARELYRGASYEDALEVLSRLRVETLRERSEISAYKALCLFALGRTEEGARLIAAVVSADPLYTLPASVGSPSMRDMFTEVRRAALPGVVSHEYADAKAAFDRKDPKTSALFDRLLLLLDDPDLEMAEKKDLREVAVGFRSLSLRFQPGPGSPSQESLPR